jgi:ribonuclease HI
MYTDGSDFKGTNHTGYGALKEYTDKTCDELLDACVNYCTNFEAEDTALINHLTSVLNLYPEKTQNIVIFTDIQSVLDTLDHHSA